MEKRKRTTLSNNEKRKGCKMISDILFLLLCATLFVVFKNLYTTVKLKGQHPSVAVFMYTCLLLSIAGVISSIIIIISKFIK